MLDYLDKRQVLIEREALRLTAMLAASEKWAPQYSKTPVQHAQLINAEAELQLVLTKFFKNMQKQVADYVNWQNYQHQISLNHTATLGRDTLAYDVNVVVNDKQIDQNDANFITITLKTVQKAVTAGFMASEITAKAPPLGLPSTDSLIQRLSLQQVADLVGKTVNPDGSIIDNPNAKYNVTDTVRNDIAQSVKTSLALGETTDEAIERMEDVINPVDRAALIARTESVNAYNAGVTEFGDQSGAVGMEWEDAGADDICADYTGEGPIPIDSDWDGLDGPPAHPNCRCAKRLIYQEEWDSLEGDS